MQRLFYFLFLTFQTWCTAVRCFQDSQGSHKAVWVLKKHFFLSFVFLALQPSILSLSQRQAPLWGPGWNSRDEILPRRPPIHWAEPVLFKRSCYQSLNCIKDYLSFLQSQVKDLCVPPPFLVSVATITQFNTWMNLSGLQVFPFTSIFKLSLQVWMKNVIKESFAVLSEGCLSWNYGRWNQQPHLEGTRLRKAALWWDKAGSLPSKVL